VHHTIPGAFPESTQDYDTNGSAIASSQARESIQEYDTHGNPVPSSQGYTTAKHGSVLVANDETGHTKLHKEPPADILAAAAKKVNL
jgi:hypothetical protein